MQRERPGGPRNPEFHALALAVGMLLAVAVTWPLIDAMPTHYVVDETMAGPQLDSMLQSWILASDVRRLGQDPLGVFDTNNMVPFRHTLAYAENLLGMAIPIAPVQLLWGNAVLTNNAALMMTIALAAWGMMLLVDELTGSLPAALIAALLLTYAPGVWVNIDQIHVACGQAAGFALFALVRIVRTRAWRYAVLLGLMTAWQAWSSLHWGVFLALGLSGTVIALFALDADARRAAPQILAGALLALVLVLPIAIPYELVAREMDLHERGGFTAFLFFGAPIGYLDSLLHPLVYFGLRWASGARSTVMLGIVPVYVAVAGLVVALLVRRPRGVGTPLVVALVAGGLVTYWYALGPLRLFGVPSLYAAAGMVPGLGIIRAPARALQYTALVLSVLAGCAVAAVLRRLRWRVARVAVVAAVVAAAVVEAGWHPGALVKAPPRIDPSTPALADLPPDCALATAPSDFQSNAIGLVQSTSHWRGMVNGRSGFYPVSPFLEWAIMNTFPSEVSLEYLRGAGACAVLVQEDAVGGRETIRRATERGLLPVRLPEYRTLIRFPSVPQPPEVPPLPHAGWRVLEPSDGGAIIDGSLKTFHTFAVATGDEPERLTVDLGREAVVTGVDLELGTHWRFFLWTYRIEGSSDGVGWSPIALSLTAVPPFASYRVDPSHIVQRIRFRPTKARFVRVAPYRRPPLSSQEVAPDLDFTRWGVAELEIRGVPIEAPPPGFLPAGPAELPERSPDAPR